MLRDGRRIAPFKITADGKSHCLVKLVDAGTGAGVLTVFVRKGTTVTVRVPLGRYWCRFAYGEIWFGDEKIFGPETTYSKANDLFVFDATEDQINGASITLYGVAYGNMTTDEIEPYEF